MVRAPAGAGAGNMTTVDVKYLTQPHDGTPGKPWEDFEQRLLDIATGKSDDRGWSLADCLNGDDEGGAAGPAIAGPAAQQLKATQARRKRLRGSCSLIAVHDSKDQTNTETNT